MLRWGIDILGSACGQWDFLAIVLYSAIAMPVMLLLLLPGTILLIGRAGKRLGRIFCAFLLTALLVGVLATIGAVVCSLA
jgi:hypothetical protein